MGFPVDFCVRASVASFAQKSTGKPDFGAKIDPNAERSEVLGDFSPKIAQNSKGKALEKGIFVKIDPNAERSEVLGDFRENTL